MYTSQPPAFVNGAFPTYVCKLCTGIYGLRQGPRVWYTELANFLLSSGFKQSVADASLFILHHSTTPIYLIVYVDDIVTAYWSKHYCQVDLRSLMMIH